MYPDDGGSAQEEEGACGDGGAGHDERLHGAMPIEKRGRGRCKSRLSLPPSFLPVSELDLFLSHSTPQMGEAIELAPSLSPKMRPTKSGVSSK